MIPFEPGSAKRALLLLALFAGLIILAAIFRGESMTTEKTVADDPKTDKSDKPQIVKHVGDEFPKLLYKLEPVPPDPPPPPKFKIVTKSVADKDEESKAEDEGWGKDVPKIPEEKAPADAKAPHSMGQIPPAHHPDEKNDKKK